MSALPDVSRETEARLRALLELLQRWNNAVRLVAPADPATLWRRHVLDSAQLWRLAPERAKYWVDLGSGGGFPGLVVAVVAAEHRPDLKVALVESDTRKTLFLSEAARRLGLSVDILRRRIERDPEPVGDVVSARALAPLPDLLALAAPWLSDGGVALFPKGARVEREVAAAKRDWRFTLTRHPSITDPRGVILAVTEPRLANSHR
jgi:16S rRNA (guanine527-N7)-methyltransferase